MKLRLSRAHNFTMMVTALKHKKDIAKGAIFELWLLDLDSKTYIVEHCVLGKRGPSAAPYKVDSVIYFTIEYPNEFTDEIRLLDPNGLSSVYQIGFAPDENPPAHAINSILQNNQNVSRETPGCDNSIVSMQIAKDIFCAKIQSGAEQIDSPMDISVMFGYADQINMKLCEMQSAAEKLPF